MESLHGGLVVPYSGTSKIPRKLETIPPENTHSLALGVKMNILLFVPGLLVLLFQYRGIKGTIEGVLIMTVIQVGRNT